MPAARPPPTSSGSSTCGRIRKADIFAKRSAIRSCVERRTSARSTAIYFLLARGERSHWHRVDAVEIWHWHAGAPLELEIAQASGARERVTLGADLAAGERPQAMVPAHAWQAAQSLGDWTLVGCTVAPGFEFANLKWRRRAGKPG